LRTQDDSTHFQGADVREPRVTARARSTTVKATRHD